MKFSKLNTPGGCRYRVSCRMVVKIKRLELDRERVVPFSIHLNPSIISPVRLSLRLLFFFSQICGSNNTNCHSLDSAMPLLDPTKPVLDLATVQELEKRQQPVARQPHRPSLTMHREGTSCQLQVNVRTSDSEPYMSETHLPK